MHNTKMRIRTTVPALLAAIVLLANTGIPGFAQTRYDNDSRGNQYSNRQGQDDKLSRAELEAEQRVSLSAETIISILRDEPGLLLQVKKMLVRKAYEQGRILDPADLTDDALYRLLRQDENVRIIATREIEDRYYIRAKPSKEELARQQDLLQERNLYRTRAPQPSGSAGATTSEQRNAGLNQEDAYWLRHERDTDEYFPVRPEFAPSQTQPASPEPAPQNPQLQNPARQVNRASLEQDQADPYSDTDTTMMTRIRADDLPELLSVATPPNSSMGAGMTAGSGNTMDSLRDRLPPRSPKT